MCFHYLCVNDLLQCMIHRKSVYILNPEFHLSASWRPPCSSCCSCWCRRSMPPSLFQRHRGPKLSLCHWSRDKMMPVMPIVAAGHFAEQTRRRNHGTDCRIRGVKKKRYNVLPQDSVVKQMLLLGAFLKSSCGNEHILNISTPLGSSQHSWLWFKYMLLWILEMER